MTPPDARSRCDAWRHPDSDRKSVQMISHWLTSTSIALAPAQQRSMNPAAMMKMSMSTTCFSQRNIRVHYRIQPITPLPAMAASRQATAPPQPPGSQKHRRLNAHPSRCDRPLALLGMLGVTFRSTVFVQDIDARADERKRGKKPSPPSPACQYRRALAEDQRSNTKAFFTSETDASAGYSRRSMPYG